MMEQTFYASYYQELKEAFESGSPSVRYNKDRAHNAVVMCFMFDHSNVVNMYCGQMSVLRKGFFEKINKSNEQDLSGLGNELQDYLKVSLDKFLAREGTRLNILFESFSDSYTQDLISKKAMQVAQSSNKLQMKVLPEDLSIRKSLDHFTVSDQGMFRFEDDKELHSAICSFHDEKSTSKLRQNFQILYGLGNNVCISVE